MKHIVHDKVHEVVVGVELDDEDDQALTHNKAGKAFSHSSPGKAPATNAATKAP